jgi:nitroreductase
MEAIEAIHTRRSIRKYSSKKVPEKAIEEILKAAILRPQRATSSPGIS